MSDTLAGLVLSLMACAPPGQTTFFASEGTAWDSPRIDLWATAFNPLDTPQAVRFTIYPDQGPGTPTGLSVTLTIPSKQRAAVHINQWLRDNGLDGNRNVSTEIRCASQCAANLAVWSHNYTPPAHYIPLTAGCRTPEQQNPYVP